MTDLKLKLLGATFDKKRQLLIKTSGHTDSNRKTKSIERVKMIFWGREQLKIRVCVEIWRVN